MVYGRRVRDKELSFEPSGALMEATLIMRDRETDSWWSIMTSSSIGGEMDGATLEELPVGEKTTWGRWRQQHPDTLVLSVDGREHHPANSYDDYFSSKKTFRNTPVQDRRLKPKAPVFSFRLGGRAYVVAHATIEGGKVFNLADLGDRRLVLYRPPGAPIFASSQAYVVPAEALPEAGPLEASIARLESGSDRQAERIAGMDTFWYSWIKINPESELLE